MQSSNGIAADVQYTVLSLLWQDMHECIKVTQFPDFPNSINKNMLFSYNTMHSGHQGLQIHFMQLRMQN